MKPKSTSMHDPCRCENCFHFRQHYVLISPEEKHFIRCSSGHCLAIRSRATKIYKTCPLFREKATSFDEN